MKIVSANILDDTRAPHENSYQKDRLQVLADDIITLCKGTPDIVYLCEISNLDNLVRLAKMLNMTPHADGYKYSDHEYMSFIVKERTQSKMTPKKVNVQGASKFGYVVLETDTDLTVVGTHAPYRPLADRTARNRFTQDILAQRTDKKFLVLGDFNNFKHMKSRKDFIRAGLKEVRYNPKPKVPSPYYKGKIIPRPLPKVVIDAIYHSHDLTVRASRFAYSKGTDHPILFAEFDT